MPDDPASPSPPAAEHPASGEEARRPGGLINWLRGLRAGRNGDTSLRDSVEALIEEREERAEPIDPEEHTLIANVLKLGTVTVYDAMVPRADVVAVEVGTAIKDVVAAMTRHGHSRLPVYRETLDDVLGMVHIRDVLGVLERANGGKKKPGLRRLMRPVLFVAPSMRVLDLLLQMRRSRNHMAMVVDEYGGIDGLVTIEDLVEEIVGEIEEEHEAASAPQVQKQSDGTLVVDARLPIDEFEERIGLVVTDGEEDGDIDTLGGLVSALAGRVPVRGELVTHPASGLEFEVIDADPRRVKRLKVSNIPAAAHAD